MVSDAIASGSVQAINYFVANNYIKALEGLAKSPNQKVLMLPVDAASFGVAEFGCLVVGETGGNLAGGWVYGLARSVSAPHSSPDSKRQPPGTPLTSGTALPGTPPPG